MHKIKYIQDCLIDLACGQLGNLEHVCAEELGEVIDMIKDLEETQYYRVKTDAKLHHDTSGGDNDVYGMEHPYKEGKSHYSRKTYMESKEMHKDKLTNLRELENYLKELSEDIVEMIEDASPEEKQLLQKKLMMLAQKVNE